MIIEKIKNMFHEMSPTNQKIAKFMFDNQSEVGFLSIQKISEMTGVSIASIVRFSKKLGFTGFNEFKKSIQQEIRKKRSPHEKMLFSDLDGQPKEKQLSAMVANQMSNFNQTIQALDVSHLEKMVKEIDKSKQIFVSGFGYSRFVANQFAYSLRNILNKPIIIISGSVSDFVTHLKGITKNDLMIVFTFPIYSKEAMMVSSHAKSVNAKLHLFTNTITCPIYPDADETVFCESNALLTENSFIGLLAVTEIISNLLILDSKEDHGENFKETFELEGRLQNKLKSK